MSKSSRMRTFFFFFNDTATTEIYTLSLHDALPILRRRGGAFTLHPRSDEESDGGDHRADHRSEEHTSELQSHLNLVCRLLLEKKKTTHFYRQYALHGTQVQQ